MLVIHVARLIGSHSQQLAGSQIHARGHAALIHIIHYLAVADAQKGVHHALALIAKQGGDAHGIDRGWAQAGHFWMLHQQLLQQSRALPAQGIEKRGYILFPIGLVILDDAHAAGALQGLKEHGGQIAKKLRQRVRRQAVVHLDPLAANIGRKQGIEGGFIIKIVPVGLIVHAADNIIGDTAGNDGAPLRIVQIVHGGDFIIHVTRVVAQRAAQHILHQPGAAFAGFFMQHIGGLAHFFPVHFHGALDRVAQFAHCQGTFFQSLRIAYTLKRNSVTSPSCIT